MSLLRTLPPPLPAPAASWSSPARRPGDRQPVPAQPQRRHHQQRRRQGRPRLHPPHRRADARRHAPARRSARSSPSTGRRRRRMAFGRDVRGAIFQKVLAFSQAETNHFGAPTLITRNTNDVQQVQTVLVIALNVMIIAPIMAVGGIIMAVREDVALSALLIVIIPLLAVFIGLMLSRALPLFRVMQVKVDRINQVMRETLAGIRVIRAFVRTEHEERRFDDANHDLTATALRVNRLFALMIPTVMAIFNLSSVAILWFGAIQVDSGRAADRQPDGVPPVRDADPVLGDDGRDHVRHGPARRGLGRADPGGPRHRRSAWPTPRLRSRSARTGRPAARGRVALPRRHVPLPGRRGAGPDGRSRSRRSRARRRRSSAARAAASRP